MTFDLERVVSYGTSWEIYFSVAHDPTELNRQGPDEGTQYRSEIFAKNDEQKRVAEAYVAQLGKAGVSSEIMTKISLILVLSSEGYHQDYATLHRE